MDTHAAFALLGLSPSASPDAVKDAYRDLVKVWHPDRFPGDPRLQAKATERMRELNEAYGVAAPAAAGDGRRRQADAAANEAAGAAHAAAPPSTAAHSTADAVPHTGSGRPQSRLSWDTIWRTLFFAGTCGLIGFLVTAPEGFFALSTGRSVGRPPRGHATGPQRFEKLPESEHGEADLVSRVRGTWVVVETSDAAWLPSGTQVDLHGDLLACRGSRPCEARVRPIGAARFAIRGEAIEDARDVEVSFASPTSMLWMTRQAGVAIGPTRRVVLESQGD